MNSKRWTWVVIDPDPRADMTLLKALEAGAGEWQGSALESISRSQLKRLMEEGKVLANNSTLKPNSKILEGWKVEILFPEPKPDVLIPEERDLEVLFEDEHLLVLNKPPGLTVHPSATQKSGTLVHALLHHVRDLSGIGGVLRPGIVHRIDKDTSGALVVTKTDLAHQRLAETFSQHAIDRVYWALCYGAPATPLKGKPIRISSLIGRHPKDRQKMSMKVKRGRNAVTYYRKLEEYRIAEKPPFASWLELSLETGRTHQIRVHLTGEGHSILGDPVYGVPTRNHPKWLGLPEAVKVAVEKLPGQALHARTLGFLHPITGEKLFFEAQPPESFSNVLSCLQQYLTP